MVNLQSRFNEQALNFATTCNVALKLLLGLSEPVSSAGIMTQKLSYPSSVGIELVCYLFLRFSKVLTSLVTKIELSIKIELSGLRIAISWKITWWW